jgi:drug/metabolite transporter (DMT)-like permease
MSELTAAKNPHMACIEEAMERLYARFGRDNCAYCLITVSALLYPLCFVYVSQHNYSPVEANLIRGVTIFITHFFIARFLGMDLDFKDAHNNKYLLIRNAIMIVNQIAYTAMHFVVPIPVINILNISGSIFAFLCDYLLYGTPLHKEQVPGIIAGCLGVAVTVNGELLMSWLDPTYEYNTEFDNYMVTSMGLRVLFCSLYILASLLWAFGLVIQKEIRGVSGLKISYHSGILFSLTTSFIYPVAVTNPISFPEFLKGCGISGLLMCFVQIMFTTAFNMSSKTGVLTMLTMLTLVTSYFISLFTYHESLNPICVVGLVLLGWGLKRTMDYGEEQKH